MAAEFEGGQAPEERDLARLELLDERLEFALDRCRVFAPQNLCVCVCYIVYIFCVLHYIYLTEMFYILHINVACVLCIYSRQDLALVSSKRCLSRCSSLRPRALVA